MYQLSCSAGNEIYSKPTLQIAGPLVTAVPAMPLCVPQFSESQAIQVHKFSKFQLLGRSLVQQVARFAQVTKAYANLRVGARAFMHIDHIDIIDMETMYVSLPGSNLLAYLIYMNVCGADVFAC